MEKHRNLIVLITPWRDHFPPEKSLLHILLDDLRNEEIDVLPITPLGPPWYRKKWPHRLRELDIDEWKFFFHHWWRHYPDWPEFYPKWREELRHMLREYDERGEPLSVVLLAPVDKERALEFEQLKDLVQALEPAAIVDLRIGEASRLMAECMPEVRAFNYPEDRRAFLHFLRSFAGERLLEPARIAMHQKMVERPKITAAYPEVMSPSCWSSMEVFIYLRNFRELVKAEIERLENREDQDYSGITSEFPKSLPVGCPIRVSLQSNSLRINPSELTINWYEPYNRLPFRISPVDEHKEGYTATLDIDVFADDLPVASMRLSIAVNSVARNGHRTSTASDASWYENIFASYAREDLKLVKHLKERYEALGLYMFIDLDDLRSGDLWQATLFDKIGSSDLFQLFWSNHAKQSKHVTVEWKHALRVRDAKGGRFIRPVYWLDQIPQVPEELSEINFRRINFRES